MTVLTAGQAHHHLVALLDHVEVRDRVAHLVAQALGELADFVIGLARVAMDLDGLGFHAGVRYFRPAMPATMRRMERMRSKVRGSSNSTMPRMATPTAPMPVQTA